MLYYELHQGHRTRDWVVMLHGLSGSTLMWSRQIDYLKKHFNLLVLDLPGHGKTTLNLRDTKKPSFNYVVDEIEEVLDHLKIERAHFMGISIGTVIINKILSYMPNRVISIVQGGAVNKLMKKTSMLLAITRFSNLFVPFKYLQPITAFILMPKANHKKSREIFIREGKKFNNKEFGIWLGLLRKVSLIYKEALLPAKKIPKLYIMGKEDHMFLKYIIKDVKKDKLARLHIIENAGHVCNIEGYMEFNEVVTAFLNAQSLSIIEEVAVSKVAI